MWISQKTNFNAFELDELFWFVKRKSRSETRANAFVMTMISREPRQIVAFDVDTSVNAPCIQRMVDSVVPARNYFTDGCSVYRGVDFVGRLRQNFCDKNDTHIIESTNADLRHYIAGLARRSRTFFRKLETKRNVLSVFVNAYNKFGEAKMGYIRKDKRRKELPFSILDFL